MNWEKHIPPALRQTALSFWSWWSGELMALLPAGMREKLSRGRQRLVVEVSDAKAVFSHARGKALKRVGTISLVGPDQMPKPAEEQAQKVQRILERAGLQGAEVALRLPRDKVLRRVVELPTAAGENLREVLGFEMDRHTPFKAQEVYYDFRVRGSDPQRKRINVDLVVAPKNVVDGILAMAESWGLELDLLEMPGESNEGEQMFDLLPRSRRLGRGRMRRGMATATAASCVLLLALAVYLPLVQKRHALANLDAEIADAREAATKADALRRQVLDLASRSRLVIDRKRGERSATELLNEVTRILPDNTWVLKFGMRNNTLTLSGYSAKPSALIGLLEKSEMLSGVRFSSPVTMDQKVGLERFNLVASIRGQGV